MRTDDEGAIDDGDKLLPEWSVSADDQIIALGLLVVAAFLVIFGWTTLTGDDPADIDTISPDAVAAPLVVGGADLDARTTSASGEPGDAPEPADDTALISPALISQTTTSQTTTSQTTVPAALDLAPEAAILAALESSGVVGAAVDMDGTAATVRGEVPSEPARTVALDAALAVPGVTAIVDGLTVVDVPEATIRELNALFELEPIQFASGSAEILASSFGTLDQAAVLLADNDAAIDVQGFTDVTGPELTNLTLSQARADAVVEYLVSNGVEAENLSSTGYGETSQFGEGGDSEALAKNRRVRFELI